MIEGTIEDFVNEFTTGDVQKNVLEFIAYLRTSGVHFERCKGYWENKLYWAINYNGESICYILIYSPASSVDSNEPWIVWSDDSCTNSFKDFPLDEHLKEIAWKNIDTCIGGDVCGGCRNPGGTYKTIFDKNFDNVCATTFRFENPDAMTVECIKKIVEIRKKDIQTQQGYGEKT